ncbi:uracil nucleotide/cysteinyl leukotriene receptor-like [Labeo rohita]|uniref:uracil nucleotide/cysteinyl leukotriene receptor-like n=1 Tax=Labeo rohita TaxID=84645 RepID=UPI0021E2AAC7|nr:uracil nucleotide/cysteinyl leukotriene receptor-like [Labeo rohita]
MNNSTVNFTTSAVSTNSTTQNSGLLDNVKFGVHCINFLFGLPTHSYVIWLIITGSESGVASSFFNLNLSVCEIANCLNSLLTVLDYFTCFSSLTILTYFLVGLAITGRPLFQCLMCVERYLAVVHPVIFLKFKPLRYRVICCAVAWLISFGSCLCCIFTLVLHNIYVYAWINSVQFLLLFFFQLFCLVAVLRALKQSEPGDRGREREEENPMKRTAFYLILITTMNMSIIYMPFTISGFIYVLTQHYFDESMSAGIICFILGGFVQPIVYLHRAGKLSRLRSP